MPRSSINQGSFFVQVARGDIDRHSTIRKFGLNPDLGTVDVFEDIWDFGGIYTFTGITPVDYYVSSSNDNDTQPVRFIGLGSDKTVQDFTMSINGQLKKKIVNPLAGNETWWRIYRVQNEGSTDIAGELYVYEDDTVTAGVPDTGSKVRAHIDNGFNQTLMAIYTVPAGKSAYGLTCRASLADRKSARVTVQIWVRPEGGVWQIKRVFALSADGTSDSSCIFVVNDEIPEKSDIRMAAATNTIGSAVSGEFEMLLVDND